MGDSVPTALGQVGYGLSGACFGAAPGTIGYGEILGVKCCEFFGCACGQFISPRGIAGREKFEAEGYHLLCGHRPAGLASLKC
jgi:hypothetical protein